MRNEALLFLYTVFQWKAANRGIKATGLNSHMQLLQLNMNKQWGDCETAKK